MLPFLPNIWKYGAISLAAVSLGLGAKVFFLNREIDSVRETLQLCQSDLTIARNNVTTLEVSLANQNLAIKNLSDESKRRLAAADAAVVAAKKQTREAQMRAGVLLKTPIKGGTLEARVLDVDAKVLEGLK